MTTAEMVNAAVYAQITDPAAAAQVCAEFRNYLFCEFHESGLYLGDEFQVWVEDAHLCCGLRPDPVRPYLPPPARVPFDAMRTAATDCRVVVFEAVIENLLKAATTAYVPLSETGPEEKRVD